MCNNYCGCPEGMRLSEDGTCKQSNGCGLNRVLSDGECNCAPGYQKLPEENTCVPTSQCDLSPGSTTTAGCCPQGKNWDQSTLKCEPGSAGPKLKIEKTLRNCCSDSRTGTTVIACSFSISVTNIGTVPYSGPVAYSDSDPNSISGSGGGGSGPVTLAPGETKVIGGVGHNYAPGTRYSNCAALVPPPRRPPTPVSPQQSHSTERAAHPKISLPADAAARLR